MFGISEQLEHVLGTVGPAPGRKAWRGGRRGRPDWAEIKSLFCSQACYLRTGAMTSLRVSILCAAAVGYVFHSKCFAGSSGLHIPGLLVIFFSQSSGAGIRTFFKPHCPRLDSQEEVGGSLGNENVGPTSGME